jgi:hypothetical protein
MSFFVFPQHWITPAIVAGVMAFGSVGGKDIQIEYVNFPGKAIAGSLPPNLIGIDKRPKRDWPKWKAQCVIVHQYGHLAGRKHVRNPRSIMNANITRRNCLPWLRRHGLR